MNVIGTIASTMFIVLALLLLAPVFFTASVRESYNKFDFWGIAKDLPNWATYILLVIFVLCFWITVGWLAFR
jgi:hypothetical protein